MDKTLARRPIGHLLDGRYRVESHLADGGMATIYLGTDTRLERTVALKIMRAEFASDEDFVRRFVAEARTVARLSHPNVVTVYDQGADGRTLYLAMEYVPGRNLRDLLRERGRLDPRGALDIMEGVLAGLGAAHEAGLAHRDVKPENVLLTDSHAVKVADFGLARLVTGAKQTKSGMIIGTAAYLAPEQVSRGTADARSDVYAAGVMLFELLTGEQPHVGENPLAVAYKHVNEVVPPPSSLEPGLPPALDALVALATSRDPDLRPGDAGQFLRAVAGVRHALPPEGGAPRGWAAGPGGAPGRAETMGSPSSGPDSGRGARPTGGDPWGGGFGPGGAGDATPPAGVVIPPSAWRPSARDGAAWDRTPGMPTSPHAPYPPGDGRGPTQQFAPDPYRSGGGGGNKTLIVAGGPGPSYDAPRYDGPPPRYGRAQPPRRYGGGPREPRLQRLLFSRRLGYLAAALAAVAVIAGVLWWKTSGQYSLVPSVNGMTAATARTELRGLGFSVVVGTPRIDNTVAQGDVIRTLPGAGAKLTKGGQVTLVVSAGPRLITVPQVTGEALAVAQSSLRSKGLTPGKVTYTASATIPTGIVLATTPAAGASQPQPQPVGLVVSAGPPVPNFVGQPKTTAEAWASANGVSLDEVASTKSTEPDGTVIRQSVAAGSTFTKGQVIIITFSQPTMVPIPTLSGMTVQQAEHTLRQLGFRYQLVSSGPFRVVFNYSPTGSAPQGATITLYVGGPGG